MKGVIAIVDALGVQTFSLEQSQRFIKIRNKIISQILKIVASTLDATEKGLAPNIHTFGDTIIFSWKDDDDESKRIPGIVWTGTWLRYLMVLGLNNNLLFRGSMAYGEYISEESTILGPAVADAVSWYEAADWFGVICVPSMQFLLRTSDLGFQKEKDAVSISPWFIEYDVPIKNSASKKLWTIPWPYDIWAKNLRDFSNKEEALIWARTHINFLLQKFIVPKGTEDKYKNSLAYFEHCILHYSNIEEEIKDPDVFMEIKRLRSKQEA